MHTGRRTLTLSLAALVSACHQPAGVGPPAAGVGAEAPRYQVLDADTTTMESAILDAINNVRAANGLGGLSLSSDLSSLAREHSQDMAARHYFNHTSPDGQGPYQRLKAAGFDFAAYGETSHFPDVRPQSAIADWLRHPGGMRQLLDSRFTAAGVGIAYSPDEQRYYVNVLYLRPNGGETGLSRYGGSDYLSRYGGSDYANW